MSAHALSFPALLCNADFSVSRQGQEGQKVVAGMTLLWDNAALKVWVMMYLAVYL